MRSLIGIDCRHFFIMRKYRRLKVAQSAVHMIFDMFSGKWRVSQFSNVKYIEKDNVVFFT
ncbi:hypothetical protein psyc5s11_23180 [Clostridium gelidum]|uniref:GNAT family N-acetyltransferase n=1 Tax=Clostridium gelidum TaxID=704125 RepID=A0ABM7T5N9_9CLOT|nr:hypothetical protein psyc5s11_23180 [Clostridium gelidum]